MRISGKKDIFFDLDHTLWDFEKNSDITFRTIFEKHGLDMDHGRFIELYVPINEHYWKLFRDGNISQEELRYGRLNEAFRQIGFRVNDELLHTLAAEYIKYLPESNHLFEGAIEVLDYLKPKYSLHIITNGFHDVQAGKLKNSNLDHYFETVTNSDMAGSKKPHAGIFEFAIKAANAQKCHSIMIGDCIEADVQGALDCGIDAIYFNESGKEAHPSIRQVGHLLELKNIL
ncbi:YjjG family noncanonical pyrimidine nucleotidase [uncultured Flavobacterium sp.]|uniref:YjjG family noncanonical pyrimidine nucleotidase n=1 Tax=uncultured Flavobacterium sp. TaxID=165435 RepID=UPI0025F25F7E|nr:YjjG family noncanonical pyrimidine nucleotidase [uncultured Flavobacterium sp.]